MPRKSVPVSKNSELWGQASCRNWLNFCDLQSDSRRSLKLSTVTTSRTRDWSGRLRLASFHDLNWTVDSRFPDEGEELTRQSWLIIIDFAAGHSRGIQAYQSSLSLESRSRNLVAADRWYILDCGLLPPAGVRGELRSRVTKFCYFDDHQVVFDGSLWLCGAPRGGISSGSHQPHFNPDISTPMLTFVGPDAPPGPR